jgi:maltose alpha-D-glucosyltransferase/alpha-amylase
MGDNIYLGDRNGVRTPMQWSLDRNAGFSRADPQRLYLPPVMDPVFGYQTVNVEAQSRSPSSLLNWTRRLIATRRRYRAFGRGGITFLEPGNRKILAFLREFEDEAILCVANLSRVPQAVELDLSRFEKRIPVELLGQESFPPIGKLPYLLTLPGYGHLAFRLAADAKPPGWHEERLVERRIPVLVLAPGWQAAIDRGGKPGELAGVVMNMSRDRLRDEVLLPYLRARRWFAAKQEKVVDTRVTMLAPWKTPSGHTWHVTFLDIELDNGTRQRYFLPMALEWESRDANPVERWGPFAIAKVRHKERVGLFYAAFANPDFARDLARAMASGGEVPLGPGRLKFSATSVLPPLLGAIDEDVRTPALEQSNTAVFFGNRLFLKGYRRQREGVNPELEMGRFLTEASPYPHGAALAGAVEYYEDGAVEPATLAVLQRFVENQGDLWGVTHEHLGRMLATPGAQASAASADAIAKDFQLGRMALVGRRVAELHRALAKPTGDAAFDPEPVSAADLAAWRSGVIAEIARTFDAIEPALAAMGESSRLQLAPLLLRRERLRERVQAVSPKLDGLMKTRFHGDLHLGQVLVAQDDFIIVDFEGEPGRSLGQRRAKSSALKDVAGMLRSFSYAAHAAALRRNPGTADAGGLEVLDAWERDATHHFLSGYRKAAAGLACVPADDDSFHALLDLFLVEKALYELRYEIANRPDWVEIPLRGLLELATT